MRALMLALFVVVGAGVVATRLVLYAPDSHSEVQTRLLETEPSSREARPDPSFAKRAPSVVGPRIDSVPLSPAPESPEPAFVGKEGRDEHGYPRRQPDMVQVLNLLRLGRYQTLEDWLTWVQDEFEADARLEEWPDIMVSSFFVADPELGPRLDAWVKASPNHFAPWVARGTYHLKRGQYERGAKWAHLTSARQFRRQHHYDELAREDFERALALRPRLVAAHRRLIIASSSRKERDRWLTEAEKQCRTCFMVRSSYLANLTPRWGGSYEVMQQFQRSRDVLVAENPRLAWLRGYVHWDRCRSWRKKAEARAKRECEAALAHGDDPRFLMTRSYFSSAKRDPKVVLRDLDRILARHPHHRHALSRRVTARIGVKDYLGAAEDLRISRHIEPTDEDGAKQVEWLVQMLRYQGSELTKQGRGDEAQAYFTAALGLAPDDHDLRRRSAWAQSAPTRDDLQSELDSNPDDFDLRLRRDHVLAKERRFPEIIDMWSDYIRHHPDDPRPYWERAGAKWHKRDLDGAQADMDQSCRLGYAKACRDAARMRARPR